MMSDEEEAKLIAFLAMGMALESVMPQECSECDSLMCVLKDFYNIAPDIGRAVVRYFKHKANKTMGREDSAENGADDKRDGGATWLKKK